ncbi:allantoicase [Rhodobium gokarnense]|uniref:Probable allantoicase n=1 Tax=Rhodobium gokarnense TaxID=364296 RepID=A0ABT3H7K0_9HYPH|nr:allantoicase [Rhodobium gokarnense]MCW2306365.1 allantoicase [Rhodobium gokarnense]
MAEIIAAAATLPDWAEGTVNLASPRLGSATVACSDDSFAVMGRMLTEAAPVFKPDVYDDFGKWMDGWETKRRRDTGHDWCIVKLGARGQIRGVDIDTSHFTGNFPPAASLWASDAETLPEGDAGWTEILSSTPLGPSAHHFAEVQNAGPWRWLRLNIFPDGGIARLRVYGTVVADWSGDATAELSALKNGGRIVAYNDAHFGNVQAILTEGRGANMGDGWETRRRREPGNDWIIVQLGAAGIVEKIEVDTAHFRGNYPDRCSLQAMLAGAHDDAAITVQSVNWPLLMGEKKLQADTVHTFEAADLADLGPVSHVKLNIFPDGGISRLRIFGKKA